MNWREASLAEWEPLRAETVLQQPTAHLLAPFEWTEARRGWTDSRQAAELGFKLRFPVLWLGALSISQSFPSFHGYFPSTSSGWDTGISWMRKPELVLPLLGAYPVVVAIDGQASRYSDNDNWWKGPRRKPVVQWKGVPWITLQRAAGETSPRGWLTFPKMTRSFSL